MDKPESTSGPTPWERFVSLARKVTQTPKAEVEKRDAAWREERRMGRSSSAKDKN